MDSVKVLVQGYAQKLATGNYHASSAAVLVRSNGKNVVIDPGLFPNELKAALNKEHLLLDDIDIVVVSHAHMDHTRNSKLFDKPKVLDLFQRKNMPQYPLIPGTDIQIIFTPGHVDKHAAFLVDTTDGKCAIAGDVFWWEDGEEQKTDFSSLVDHVDAMAKNASLLQESRKKLLSVADFIVPGHGKVFAVPK